MQICHKTSAFIDLNHDKCVICYTKLIFPNVKDQCFVIKKILLSYNFTSIS